jgi:hypothetical protein
MTTALDVSTPPGDRCNTDCMEWLSRRRLDSQRCQGPDAKPCARLTVRVAAGGPFLPVFCHWRRYYATHCRCVSRCRECSGFLRQGLARGPLKVQSAAARVHRTGVLSPDRRVRPRNPSHSPVGGHLSVGRHGPRGGAESEPALSHKAPQGRPSAGLAPRVVGLGTPQTRVGNPMKTCVSVCAPTSR